MTFHVDGGYSQATIELHRDAEEIIFLSLQWSIRETLFLPVALVKISRFRLLPSVTIGVGHALSQNSFYFYGALTLTRDMKLGANVRITRSGFSGMGKAGDAPERRLTITVTTPKRRRQPFFAE